MRSAKFLFVVDGISPRQAFDAHRDRMSGRSGYLMVRHAPIAIGDARGLAKSLLGDSESPWLRALEDFVACIPVEMDRYLFFGSEASAP